MGVWDRSPSPGVFVPGQGVLPQGAPAVPVRPPVFVPGQGMLPSGPPATVLEQQAPQPPSPGAQLGEGGEFTQFHAPTLMLGMGPPSPGAQLGEGGEYTQFHAPALEFAAAPDRIPNPPLTQEEIRGAVGPYHYAHMEMPRPASAIEAGEAMSGEAPTSLAAHIVAKAGQQKSQATRQQEDALIEKAGQELLTAIETKNPADFMKKLKHIVRGFQARQ